MQLCKRIQTSLSSTVVYRLPVLMVLLFFFGAIACAQAQTYDLLLKGGHVLDPKNKMNAQMDVAVKDGKIAKVSKNLEVVQAKKVIDAKGLLITPGLIDIHTHVFVGNKPGTFANGFSSVSPDDFTFRSGVTTVVDAGTSGWRNFPDFKKQIIDPSATRVLAFLNIAGSGMQGKPYEEEINDMDAEQTALTVQNNKDYIVGVKLGHFTRTEWTPFERATDAGKRAGVPLLLECHLPQLPLKELLTQMRPGDIFTHAFGKVDDRESIINQQGKVHPYVLEAKAKGIKFDVGHGGGSFHFSEAIPAVQQGLLPDAFGTDLHRFSMNSAMKDMLNIMSKFLNMGMPLNEIIFRATWNPAQTIKREDLGHLTEGAVADIAILRLRKGDFGFIDSGGKKIKGAQKLEAELTIRAGRVVWDLNGLAASN